jgi:hypothetical protein
MLKTVELSTQLLGFGMDLFFELGRATDGF